MILDPGTGLVDLTYVYALNKTAAWLWDRLTGTDFTRTTIIKLLQSHYELSFEEAERDGALFWATLLENELCEQEGNTNER